MKVTELVLHPVRLRIIRAMSGGRELTTGELCARTPDVSKVTVYRHVAVLLHAGYLEVAGEQRVRGAVERRYRLAQNRLSIDEDAAAAMSLDDHRRGFAIAMIGLICEFNAYLDRDGANPSADSVSYRQGTIWASPEDLNQLRRQMLAAMRPLLANAPGPDRLPYHLSPVLFPAEPPAR